MMSSRSRLAAGALFAAAMAAVFAPPVMAQQVLAQQVLAQQVLAQQVLAQQVPAQQPGTAPNAAAICAPCHGFDGVGRDVEIPNLAGQHSIYLRNQLLAFKNGRRKHPEMRYVARELSEREMEELVVYYSTLLPP